MLHHLASGFCSTRNIIIVTGLLDVDGIQLLNARNSVNVVDKRLPTTFTEFLAVLFALRLYGPLYAGSAVRVFCDNTGVVQDWLSRASPDSTLVQADIQEPTLLTTHLSFFLPTIQAFIYFQSGGTKRHIYIYIYIYECVLGGWSAMLLRSSDRQRCGLLAFIAIILIASPMTASLDLQPLVVEGRFAWNGALT